MADFFDKMKAGIDRSMANMSANSKNMVEKSKINTTINNYENEKKQLIEVLGTKLYNFYVSTESGDFPRSETQALANEIIKRDELIAQQQVRLQELEEERNIIRGNSGSQGLSIPCSACGHANSLNAKFCAKCGQPLA